MSLSVNTPDSDNLEVSSVHELFRLTLSLHSVHCSLLPEQGKSVKVYFTSEHSFMDLRCAMSSHTDECDIIYLCKYIQFKFRSRTLKCTLNGTYMFASNWNHGGISCDVHFPGHLCSNRTNVWSDKMCRRGGVRTGILNRWLSELLLRFTMPNPKCNAMLLRSKCNANANFSILLVFLLCFSLNFVAFCGLYFFLCFFICLDLIYYYFLHDFLFFAYCFYCVGLLQYDAADVTIYDNRCWQIISVTALCFSVNSITNIDLSYSYLVL